MKQVDTGDLKKVKKVAKKERERESWPKDCRGMVNSVARCGWMKELKNDNKKKLRV